MKIGHQRRENSTIKKHLIIIIKKKRTTRETGETDVESKKKKNGIRKGESKNTE